jgi:hypothetical protein
MVTLKENALVDLQAAKIYMSVPTDAYDEKIRMFINQASSMIESHTKRVLYSKEHSEYYDGRKNNRIIINQFPILGGSANGNKPVLYISANWDYSTPVDPNSYNFTDDEIVYNSVFPKGTRNIKVIYRAGLGNVDENAGTNTFPEDLQIACLMTVDWLYSSSTDKRIGKSSRNKGDESVGYSFGLPQEVVEILDKGYTRDEMPTMGSVGVRNS